MIHVTNVDHKIISLFKRLHLHMIIYCGPCSDHVISCGPYMSYIFCSNLGETTCCQVTQIHNQLVWVCGSG